MNFLAFGDRAGRHMYGRGDFFPIGAVVGMLLLAGLVAAIVVLATRSSRRHASGGFAPSSVAAPIGVTPSSTDDALNLARLRYARGEMTRDEYLQTAADLGGAIVPAPPMATTTSPPTTGPVVGEPTVTPPTDG